MNVIQSLQSISLYPIPVPVAQNIAIAAGLDIDEDFTQDTFQLDAYKRAKAKVYEYLSEAPKVTEAGATYEFTEEEQKTFLKKAQQLLCEIGESTDSVDCGYFGEDF